MVFQWTEDYDFVWSQRGKLASGITFTASQVIPANRPTANQVTLIKHSNGAYSFAAQEQGSEPNILFINQDKTITPTEVLVGIGMAGSATALVQALPNVVTTFKVHENPKYRIFWGAYKAGQALNLNEITNEEEIEFKYNISSLTVILQEDNTWCVEQTKQAECKE